MGGRWKGTLLDERILLGSRIGATQLSEVYIGTNCENLVAVKINKDSDDDHYRVMQDILQIQHPNIITPTEIFYWNEKLVEVMPYRRGTTVDRLHGWSYEDAIEFMQEAACGVAYLHKNGIIHRDTRARNIMLGDRTFVFDFNVACRPHFKNSRTPRAKNTAPEYCTGGKIGFAYDVYLLGKTLKEVMDRRSDKSNGPPPCKEVINIAMAEDPDDRYADAAQFREALLKYR